MTAPLFLLAPPRSFTSLVSTMLGQHPQAFGLMELNLFTADKMIDLWYSSSSGMSIDAKFRHGLLRVVAEIYAGEQTDEAIEFAQHWCAARESRCTGDVFCEIAARLDPLIPIEKSPACTIDVSHMERIYRACPDARFIHLVRHPVMQCESLMEMNQGAFPLFLNAIEYRQDRAVIEPQLVWHDLNVNILNFLEKNVPEDRHILLRAEDLLAQPEEKLAEICCWLGISDGAEAMDAMMHPERSPFACLGPATALCGNDPGFLTDSGFRKRILPTPPLEEPVKWRDDGKGLYPEVVELAHEFGYGQARP
ncbi:MAG: sulfotransferase [Pseudomonadota bacterium]